MAVILNLFQDLKTNCKFTLRFCFVAIKLESKFIIIKAVLYPETSSG